jgi:hypothetical protein
VYARAQLTPNQVRGAAASKLYPPWAAVAAAHLQAVVQLQEGNVEAAATAYNSENAPHLLLVDAINEEPADVALAAAFERTMSNARHLAELADRQLAAQGQKTGKVTALSIVHAAVDVWCILTASRGLGANGGCAHTCAADAASRGLGANGGCAHTCAADGAGGRSPAARRLASRQHCDAAAHVAPQQHPRQAPPPPVVINRPPGSPHDNFVGHRTAVTSPCPNQVEQCGSQLQQAISRMGLPKGDYIPGKRRAHLALVCMLLRVYFKLNNIQGCTQVRGRAEGVCVRACVCLGCLSTSDHVLQSMHVRACPCVHKQEGAHLCVLQQAGSTTACARTREHT